jgi:hypothetical protein
MDTIFDGEVPRARLALLLRHFSELKDNREPWRIVYPLQEVLLLVTCATIASCDDFDDIVAWGKHHLVFLRHFSEFHHGIPCERWLRALLNRIDPILFGRCFNSWIAALWPNRHEFIAIDGKTSRRTHDQRKGLKALHTLSAYATHARLTLAQVSVPEKTNEITAIPDLLDQLAETKQLEGALVSIDAMGCQVEIADKIVAHKVAIPKLTIPTAPYSTAASREATSREAWLQITDTPGPSAMRASSEREVTAMTAALPDIPDAPAMKPLLYASNRNPRWQISHFPARLERYRGSALLAVRAWNRCLRDVPGYDP